MNTYITGWKWAQFNAKKYIYIRHTHSVHVYNDMFLHTVVYVNTYKSNIDTKQHNTKL